MDGGDLIFVAGVRRIAQAWLRQEKEEEGCVRERGAGSSG